VFGKGESLVVSIFKGVCLVLCQADMAAFFKIIKAQVFQGFQAAHAE
jgi:hypothetical protein